MVTKIMVSPVKNKSELLKCQFCGHRGPGVHYSQCYVGGQGYVWFVACEDERECKKRQIVQEAT